MCEGFLFPLHISFCRIFATLKQRRTLFSLIWLICQCVPPRPWCFNSGHTRWKDADCYAEKLINISPWTPGLISLFTTNSEHFFLLCPPLPHVNPLTHSHLLGSGLHTAPQCSQAPSTPHIPLCHQQPGHHFPCKCFTGRWDHPCFDSPCVPALAETPANLSSSCQELLTSDKGSNPLQPPRRFQVRTLVVKTT